jgi:adenylate kinase family enzyme
VQRIVVVGSGGVGKTTLAAALAARLGVPHVELDSLYWGPNWTGSGGSPEGDERFRSRVAAAVSGDAWVVDGNYSVARRVLWPRADTVVWLDYPLPLVLGRLLRRTMRRAWTRELLWGTNRESFRELLSRDSLIWWVLTTHHRRRRTYAAMPGTPEFAHLAFVRLCSPQETEAWLAAAAGERHKQGGLPAQS